jgi:hypothetical protein
VNWAHGGGSERNGVVTQQLLLLRALCTALQCGFFRSTKNISFLNQWKFFRFRPAPPQCTPAAAAA